MMAEDASDEPQIPGSDTLAEEIEEAIAQVRRGMADLPPLEELAGLQEALAGLAGMGTIIEKMRLAAQERDELVAELVGEPDWRVEAEIGVKKGISMLMQVRLTADFDLARIVRAHDMLTNAEVRAQIAATLEEMGLDRGMIQKQVARVRGIALVGELNLLEYHNAGARQEALKELRLTPEANVPLEVSDERELCFELAPALTIRASMPESDVEQADIPTLAPTIDQVRVRLDSFGPGKPFRLSLSASQEELALELKLAFRPL
jgi:hypothetical protein